eukprot:476015-Prorocentrum_minimum.AAC.1
MAPPTAAVAGVVLPTSAAHGKRSHTERDSAVSPQQSGPAGVSNSSHHRPPTLGAPPVGGSPCHQPAQAPD